ILDEFELTDANAPIVADICRKLDGIPLLIEFAAARIDMFGARGLAARLDDPLRFLTSGRRTALPRHQTLRTMLDWSYERLSEPERVALRRLSIFAGGFTPGAARAISTSGENSSPDAAEHVASLVMKSLIVADVGASE